MRPLPIHDLERLGFSARTSDSGPERTVAVPWHSMLADGRGVNACIAVLRL